MKTQPIEGAQQDAGVCSNGPDKHRGCSIVGLSSTDADAWELLVRRYRPFLMRLATSYNIGEDAEDAVQTTFLRLLQYGDSIRDPEAVRGWLAKVLRNECLKVISRRRRERLVEHDTLDALLPPVEGEVDIAMLRAESVLQVRQALRQLPLRQRQLLELLADPDTRNYRSLAEQLNMPIGTVGPTRQRALARLKAALIDLHYHPRDTAA